MIPWKSDYVQWAKSYPTPRQRLWMAKGSSYQLVLEGNPKQTAEAMERDDDGCLWMRTGDEAVFDDEGYCSITGRIKDIIIRGRYSWQGKLLLTHPMQEARTYFLSRSKKSLVNTDLSSSPASLVYLTTSTAKWSQHSCSIERQSHVRPVKF